ncbi:hypothetical protein BDR22DRAFT_520315 [Usnea florida]
MWWLRVGRCTNDSHSGTPDHVPDYPMGDTGQRTLHEYPKCIVFFMNHGFPHNTSFLPTVRSLRLYLLIMRMYLEPTNNASVTSLAKRSVLEGRSRSQLSSPQSLQHGSPLHTGTVSMDHRPDPILPNMSRPSLLSSILPNSQRQQIRYVPI